MFNELELKLILYALRDKLGGRRHLLGDINYEKAKLEPGNSINRYYQLYLKVQNLLENDADK